MNRLDDLVVPVKRQNRLDDLIMPSRMPPAEIPISPLGEMLLGATPEQRAYRQIVGEAVIAGLPKIERNVWEKISESARRGIEHGENLRAFYRAGFEGTGILEQAIAERKRLAQIEQTDPVKGNWFTGSIYGAARMVPDMAKGYLEGLDEAAIGAGAGAVAGGIAGAPAGGVGAIPGAAAGSVWGAGIGLQAGAARYWYELGYGEILATQLDNGVDPTIAKRISTVAALPYAAIEFLQVKGLTKLAQKSLEKTVKHTAAQIAKRALIQYGKTVGEETLEEMEQEAIVIISKDIGQWATKNKIEFEEDYLVKRLGQILETGKQTIGPMAILGGVGGAVGMAQEITETQPQPPGARPAAITPPVTLPVSPVAQVPDYAPALQALGYTASDITRLKVRVAKQIIEANLPAESVTVLPDGTAKYTTPLPTEAPPGREDFAPEPAEAKEPWEMTLEQWESGPLVAFPENMPLKPGEKRSIDGFELYAKEKAFSLTEGQVHRRMVEQAVKQGKPVPPEVLADYPDLMAKYGKPAEAKGIPIQRGAKGAIRLPGEETFPDEATKQAVNRVDKMINRKPLKPSLKDAIENAWIGWRTAITEEFTPLEARIKQAGIKLEDIPESHNPLELAIMFRSKAGGVGHHFVTWETANIWGDTTGIGLKQVMAPVAKNIKQFTRYILAVVNKNDYARGVLSGIDIKDAEATIKHYDNPVFQETAKGVTEWSNRVLDYLIEAGALTAEDKAAMNLIHPIYVPLLKAFVKGEIRRGGGTGLGPAGTAKAIYERKGSARPTIDPFETLGQQVERLVTIAQKTMVARELANLAKTEPLMSDVMRKIPPPKSAITFDVERIKKQLEEIGVPIPENADGILTLYANSPVFLGKENVTSFVIEGKREFYEFDPLVYRMLKGLDNFTLPPVLNLLLGKPTRALRLGATGINEAFGLIRNPIRDALDTIFKAEHARGPLASVRGLARDLSTTGLARALGIKPDDAARRYMALGGGLVGFASQDRTLAQHLRGEMLASSWQRWTFHTVAHPIEALRALFNIPESAPRIDEMAKAYQWAIKQGKSHQDAVVYAFNKAQDQTWNPTRKGTAGKWINSMVAFWNPAVQDISKVARTFKKHPLKATLSGLGLTISALALWWLNKDKDWWKNLPVYEKTNYVHVEIPGTTTVIRIPVPFLVGHLFMAIPVATFDAAYQADPAKVTEVLKEVFDRDILDLASPPSAVAPLIEIAANKDWAGRPIVPKSEEGKLPDDQYNRYTTELAKSIGKVLKLSPAKLEYLVNSWSGGLYRRTVPKVEKIAGVSTVDRNQPSDWPLIGTLILRDPSVPKAQVERFYDRRELLDRKYRSQRITLAERRTRAYYLKISQQLSPLWKRLRDEKDDNKRDALYKKIGILIDKAEKLDKPRPKKED